MKKFIVVLVIGLILFLLWEIYPLILFLLENPEKLGEVFEAFFVTGGIGIFTD